MQLNWKDFIVVTKPGIVISNLMVAAGAYLFAAGRHPSWSDFVGLMIGTALVIAASCVWNNYLDRAIDRQMVRTATRPSATGVLGKWVLLPYGGLLMGVGIGVLMSYTNALTTAIGVIGAIWYVVIYGYAKRRTPWATLIGTASGATPPLAGYAAATNNLEVVGWILFGVLVAWQMPHFYAIALFREREYARANVPVLSVVRGRARTALAMRLWGMVFFLALTCFCIVAHPSLLVAMGVVTLAIWWLRVLQDEPSGSDTWARGVFKFSLLILPLFSLLLALDPWLKVSQ